MRLNKFCYCGSIRTGSFIVGITELILAGLFLVLSFGNILELNRYLNYVTLETYFKVSHASYFYFGFAVISVISYIASIYGINKKKRVLLLPYLILNGISVSLLVSMWFIIIGFTMYTWFDIAPANLVIILCALAISFIYSVIKIYFWLTIYSYYKEITTDKHFRTVYRSNDSNENPDKYILNDQRLMI